jgi:hypothetical protein
MCSNPAEKTGSEKVLVICGAFGIKNMMSLSTIKRESFRI